MKVLSKKASDRISGNQRIIGRLMALFNKSSFTINRWIEDKDLRLISPDSIEVIREETGLADDEILEVEPEGMAQ